MLLQYYYGQTQIREETEKEKNPNRRDPWRIMEQYAIRDTLKFLMVVICTEFLTLTVFVERIYSCHREPWKDQLNRQYGLLSLCGIVLTVDCAWIALPVIPL
ncbi:hypothetical protein V1527DRAFT_479501 [Lipomyces starkeyi]